MLTHLARHSDQIVSKEQLLDAIWEEPELVTPNVIEVAINQIRQKMDKPLNISTIETVRRRGYRFCFPKILIFAPYGANFSLCFLVYIFFKFSYCIRLNYFIVKGKNVSFNHKRLCLLRCL